MSIIVSNIRLGLDEDEETAVADAKHRLGVSNESVKYVAISGRAVDARHKNSIMLIYSVEVALYDGEKEMVEKINSSDVKLKSLSWAVTNIGNEPMGFPPVIAGFGPAGMFAGIVLAEMGYKPIIFERGSDIDTRTQKVNSFWKDGVLDCESNVQFGEGGAGTFSDGKLTTRINDSRCGYILDKLVEFGAPDEVRILAKPHIGTDKLRNVVKNIRNRIIELGGQVYFNSRVDDFTFSNDNILKSVKVSNVGEIPAKAIIIATGHSARDVYEKLAQLRIEMTAKPFSVGVRIEQRQSDINNALYGKLAGHPKLKAADYNASYRLNNRGVYTFCMCPGGLVIASASENDTVVTNGMSYFTRTGENANAALVVSVDNNDYGNKPLDGMHFQRMLERKAFVLAGSGYKAPTQKGKDFITGRKTTSFDVVKPSYQPGVTSVDLNDCLPKFVTDMLKIGLNQFEKKIDGFASLGAVLTGVETRTSAPVRINRNDEFQSTGFSGIYPCGEGAGYAGGIMSAAADGIRVAESIISKYAPL